MNDQLALFETSVVNDLTQKLCFPVWYEDLLRHWDRLRAAAAIEFSDESLAANWVNRAFGDRECFQHMPKWEQRAWVERYRYARSRIDRFPGYNLRMATPQEELAEEERLFQEEEKMATRWAIEIKQAALENRPCPFTISDEADGFQKMRFRDRLSRAFDLAGVVIVQTAAPEEKPKGRRRRAENATP